MSWAPLVLAALAALAVRAAAQDSPFVGSTETQSEILGDIASRSPRRFRQVGTSSVTLRTDLGNGIEAAYKPRTHGNARGYAAEIAAYRLARLLGMDNVPPAISRRIGRPALEERFESEHAEDWEAIRREIVWDASGMARGVAIYWIPRMRSSDLALLPGLESATPWLSLAGELPPQRAEIARDLSTLIAFDYLIGNWDRFSGGNVSSNEAGDRLFVRDHNTAFQPLSTERYARIRSHLERVQRFSRGFVARVEALDDAAIRRALAEDPEHEERPLLNDAQIAAVLARRTALLSYVGGLATLHGPERVLLWR